VKVKPIFLLFLLLVPVYSSCAVSHTCILECELVCEETTIDGQVVEDCDCDITDYFIGYRLSSDGSPSSGEKHCLTKVSPSC